MPIKKEKKDPAYFLDIEDYRKYLREDTTKKEQALKDIKLAAEKLQKYVKRSDYGISIGKEAIKEENEKSRK